MTDNRFNNAEYLVDKYLNDIIRMSLVYVKDMDDAQDVAQQVFLTYLKKKPEFESEQHAKNWLIRVTANMSKNHMRSKRSDVSFEELSGVLSTEDTEYNEQIERDNEVLNAVMSLKRVYREVIHLYYYEEYDTGEISKILGIPSSSVRTRLARARTLLEKTLKGGENSYNGQLQESNGQSNS